MKWVRVARICVALALLASSALAVVLAIDEYRRQSVFRLVATDLDAAARRIVATQNVEPLCTTQSGAPHDLDTLMAALTTVETIATGTIERHVEGTLVAAARLFRAPAPDISIGPAQIRVSTALAAASWARANRCARTPAPEPKAVARDLLSRTGAHDWGVLILSQHAAETATSTAPLNRAGIMRLAAGFNGQTTTPDAQAAIANTLYRELVYRTYLEFKFQRNDSAQPCGRSNDGPRSICQPPALQN